MFFISCIIFFMVVPIFTLGNTLRRLRAKIEEKKGLQLSWDLGYQNEGMWLLWKEKKKTDIFLCQYALFWKKEDSINYHLTTKLRGIRTLWSHIQKVFIPEGRYTGVISVVLVFQLWLVKDGVCDNFKMVIMVIGEISFS